MVSTLLFSYALIVLLSVVVVFLGLAFGMRRIRRLAELASPTPEPPEGFAQWPLVSVIVAARNEERHIAASIQSLLKLDYQPLEITVVNDRSSDRTGEILDELAGRHPQLNIVHLTELPTGWLGKNHALQYGADRSRGTWLLFSDADIMFEPTVLRRAIRYSLEQRLAHFALMPEMDMPTWMLEAFVVAFALFLTIFTRPWNARNMRSRAHLGVGAFNLVRADAYRDVEGHRRLAMRPDDDLKLAKVLKFAGHQPDLLDGAGLLSVPWYGSIREVFVGLEKNTFAALEYNVVLTVLSGCAMLACNVAPYLLVWVTSGATRWMLAAAALLQWMLAWGAAYNMRARPTVFLGFPLAVVLFVVIQWRAMVLALYNGGIRWRDTFYSLAQLKANRV